MASLERLRENWLRPFFFFGNNLVSLIGGALTTASAFTLIGFWVVDIFGKEGSDNPYVGIIFDLCLPALFVFGLILIPIGMWFRRRSLKAAGQLPTQYPQIDLKDPRFRHGLDLVLIVTFINFIIIGTGSYRAVAHMETPGFCGQSCHVMTPEWVAYQKFSHRDVACTHCHIAEGIPGFITAKVNGTRQLIHVVLNNYPRPVMPEGKVPPAEETCLNCHNPDRLVGNKVFSKVTYGDDEKNSVTRTLVLVHVGGRDQFGRLSGIHGAHLGHIEYIATDTTHQTIPWVSSVNADGSTTEFVSSDAKQPIAGQKRLMDCMDCHNRAAHSFDTPEAALNKAMAAGSPSASLPFVHKEGLALMKASYSSQQEAASQIKANLEEFYRSQYPAAWSGQRTQIDQAASTFVRLYSENVFPDMKVTWGTHPDNIGHTDYPGCFRCHDGSHVAKNEKAISNDCSLCHNLMAVDEANPKILADLGIQ
jgi:nitrate/TMAO reductase-like tetraheme cytochrome c subunit